MLVNIRGGGLILINPSGWRGELRVKFFFQQITTLQSSSLNYECNQSQSTLHVLVCPGLRSRVSGLLTQLNL